MTWITAKFPHLAPKYRDKIGALTTTRESGVSSAPFDSLNIATHVGDVLTDVRANRAILREALSNTFGISSEPYWLEQTHSNQVLSLPSQYFHECATNKVPQADASFTQQEQIICAVMTADCLPLLIVNDQATEVAAIHAGWRGLHNGIIGQTINSMTSENELLHVWLGPAIGPTAFEVGEDVRQQFIALSPDYSSCFMLSKTQPVKKYMADIYHIAKLQLAALGVQFISGAEYCTYQQSKLFYSYRKEGVTGRMASLIWINDQLK